MEASEVIQALSKDFSETEFAILNSPSYVSWIEDLLALMSEFPDRFKEVFSKERENEIQNAVIKHILINL